MTSTDTTEKGSDTRQGQGADLDKLRFAHLLAFVFIYTFASKINEIME